MKYIFIYISLFFSTISFAQYYGADGGVVAFGRIVIHAAIEEPKYKEIEKWQELIIASNGIIAAETTALNALEKDLYEGFTKIDETLKSTQLIFLISEEFTVIHDYIKKIKKLGEDNAMVHAYTLDKEAFLLAEIAFIMNDYLLATSQSKKNLLNSADRYFILDFFYDRIVKLRKQTIKLHYETKVKIKLLKYDFDQEVKIDFTPLHDKMKGIYDEIFPKTIKE